MSLKQDRRSFICTTAAVAVVTTLLPQLALGAEKDWVADLGAVRDLDSGDPILVNAQFKNADGKVMDDEKVYVRGVKRGDSCDFVVLSAICTHLKCKLEFKPDSDKFICPCHKSEFDLDGTVLKKPAKKDLPDFSDRVSVEDGRVLLRKR